MIHQIELLAAEKHTSEYLLHKYWARKPHNIIAHFIERLVPEGGIIVDPFCGSGVVLHEAQKQNKRAIGFDINPTAVLISKVLINPPEISEFSAVVESLLSNCEREINDSFSFNGKLIKYCVHQIVSKCPSCGKLAKQQTVLKNGKKCFCSSCQAIVKFNLENMADTEIVSFALDREKMLITDPEALLQQQKKTSEKLFDGDTSKYIFQFNENRRILAFKGMNTSSLFTERNFSILCYLSDQINKIANEQIRDAAQLLLSASCAQCSRLIPIRNNLSTGGPAWSVPGFWVPAEHLETNPIVHLRARFEKFKKGIALLDTQKGNYEPCVAKDDFASGIDQVIENGIKADLVFFDPPYGDSIPYIEFSSIWNSFLRDFPEPLSDISVSDRVAAEDAWQKYGEDLHKAIFKISCVLKDQGHLLITFNNNDLRAWESLLSSLQDNHFICDFVTYQIPAVISAKAQFSVAGSYISDIYAVYSYNKNIATSFSLEPIAEALIKCAKFRGGIISKSLAQRMIMIAGIRENIDVTLLREKDNILKSIFDETAEGKFILKNNTHEQSEFQQIALELARKHLGKGPCQWSELYVAIASAVSEFGIPDPDELKDALGQNVLFDGKRCIACLNTEKHS